MEPIVLIHGYSAESRKTDAKSIAAIYGHLPEKLRDAYGGAAVTEIDLSRYISLEDGVTLDDVSRALDRALRSTEYRALLVSGFHVIVHSTGALVIRNWVRKFSAKPSPVKNLVYLAGANFGSGWGHIGKGQLAKGARKVFQEGAEPGRQVLDALELGSSWTLDLHAHFLRAGARMLDDYEIREHVVIGTQADPDWFSMPVRYGHEDGSDGVVRVAGSDLNFQYIRLAPTPEAREISWRQARVQRDLNLTRESDEKRLAWYRIEERSLPGEDGRALVPLGIPYECAHSGEGMGIVVGKKPVAQVMRLVRLALESTAQTYPQRVAEFQSETDRSYARAKVAQAPAWWKQWISEPRRQYDEHAQVIFRLRDQDGRPVEHFDIFFDSVWSRRDKSLAIGKLFQDKHKNDVTPNVIAFYLRTKSWDDDAEDWVDCVPKVNGCYLEITAVEPETGEILYLPLRFEIKLSARVPIAQLREELDYSFRNYRKFQAESRILPADPDPK